MARNYTMTWDPASVSVQPVGWTGSPLTLVFEDHFDGPANSAPNLAKWEYWLKDQTRNNATNRDKNTLLDGSSNLVVSSTNLDIGYGVENSAGGLETLVKTYGPGLYCEARIKSVSRSWFGFWSNTDGGMDGLNTPPDPADGCEPDFWEDLNGTTLQHAINYGGYGAHHQVVTSAIGLDPTAAFHVSGYQWDLANNLNRFFIDGTQTWTSNAIVSTRSDNFIRLTQEWKTGQPFGSTLVDYVRIWVP